MLERRDVEKLAPFYLGVQSLLEQRGGLFPTVGPLCHDLVVQVGGKTSLIRRRIGAQAGCVYQE